MMALTDTSETGRAERIEALLQQISQLPDAQARAQMEELTGALLDLFGDGLARMLTLTEQSPGGVELIRAFADDGLVGSLLLRKDVFDDLRAYRAAHGLPTWEQTISRLLASADVAADVEARP